MKKLSLVLALVAALVAGPLALTTVQKLSARTATEVAVNPAYQSQALPAAKASLEEVNKALPKQVNAKRTLTLEATNVVVLKGPVTDDSVSAVMKELQAASRRNPKNVDLYLVLDTPGGSIPAGMDLIDYAKALPQKVHTVTLFAASMGFQIAQNLDTRYIVNSGISMSHRATLAGLDGQINGELESRYKMIRRSVDYLDVVASQRLGMDLDTYRARILNEMWVFGFDAQEEKVADEMVLLKCGESLNGSYTQTFNTFFGPVDVVFNKCPLIKAPEAIIFKGGDVEVGDKANKLKAEQEVREAFYNQEKFVREIIVPGKFNTLFK